MNLVTTMRTILVVSDYPNIIAFTHNITGWGMELFSECNKINGNTTVIAEYECNLPLSLQEWPMETRLAISNYGDVYGYSSTSSIR